MLARVSPSFRATAITQTAWKKTLGTQKLERKTFTGGFQHSLSLSRRFAAPHLSYLTPSNPWGAASAQPSSAPGEHGTGVTPRLGKASRIRFSVTFNQYKVSLPAQRPCRCTSFGTGDVKSKSVACASLKENAFVLAEAPGCAARSPGQRKEKPAGGRACREPSRCSLRHADSSEQPAALSADLLFQRG